MGGAEYGSVAGSGPRKRARVGRAALVVGALAVLALCGLASIASRSVSTRVVSLLTKQQAAWYDGTSVMQEDHNKGHWGWKSPAHARTHAAAPAERRQAKAPAQESNEQQQMDRIDSVLDKAVGMLKDLKSAQAAPAAAQQPAARQHQLALGDEQPKCFSKHGITSSSAEAMRRVGEAADNLAMAYPSWAKGQDIPGTGQDGEWRHDRGPPYVMRLTMFSGEGVDSVGTGTLVRRILGLKTAFNRPCDLRSCQHAWSNNNFLTSFDGPQFRFLYRNVCSALVIPPLVNGAGPILSTNGMYRLHHFLASGHNTLIVCGSVANILFLNQNVATRDGGFSLVPDWVDGPYEAQKAQLAETPFAALGVTLPGPGTSVSGVKISSLPASAISYYEAGDVSVLFEIPVKEGRIIYLGYDFSEPVTQWVHALVASTQFTDF